MSIVFCHLIRKPGEKKNIESQLDKTLYSQISFFNSADQQLSSWKAQTL